MMKRLFAKAKSQLLSPAPVVQRTPPVLEQLENRQLFHGFGPGGPGGFGPGEFGHGGPGGGGFSDSTILFSQAPAAVQTGLTALAATDSVTAPTASTTVHLGNSNGVESYTVDIAGTGTDTRLTVDQNGDPVTAPTRTSTTFGAVTNTAVTAKITAIAAALGLTAPATDTAVEVTTPAGGTAVYTVRLDRADTTTTSDGYGRRGGGIISVDADGNPVGNGRLPLSTLPTAVQNGLNANAPAGATALTSTSLVEVRTLDGVTTYSATFAGTGTQTEVTVNTAGVLTSLPSSTQVEFSTLPAAAQTELQTLATADGVTGTIAATQTVTAYAGLNGTTIYTVRLTATSTDGTDSTTTETYTVALSVDQAGNPTVPPRGGFGGRGPGGFQWFDDNGGCGLAAPPTTGTTSGGTTTGGTTTGTTTTTTDNSSMTAAALASTPISSSSSASSKKAARVAAKAAAKAAKAAAKAAKAAARLAAKQNLA